MTERFLGYFFDSCIAALYKPLSDVPEWRDVPSQCEPTPHSRAMLTSR